MDDIIGSTDIHRGNLPKDKRCWRTAEYSQCYCKAGVRHTGIYLRRPLVVRTGRDRDSALRADDNTKS